MKDFHRALILGGAKSGKSRYGLNLAQNFPPPRLFVATGQPGDEEMAARIARHRQDRGPGWETREEPLDVAAALDESQGRYGVILVDCLTLWLSNLMLREGQTEAGIDLGIRELLEVFDKTATPVILISNEVGLGIVPENALARAFRDQAGRLHQKLAAAADLVALVVAGLPWIIKGV
ncbi:MAG: bifunctional adenosylcobinamide kinase/adenosylcobinamide-phosphate guanylyltransferase [Deltaproteobacteria bacterium]|nr:bifunctional adenosylcobinamide kinase/adenosylcobinamide-phosphate guanylyltransferase [Deltaproteobacteria bacterium]